MTEVVVEAAMFRDAIQKVVRVAPMKGASFDLASGVILDVRPATTSPLNVRATDLESTYFQKLPGALATGESVLWRIPSAVLAAVAANLPIGPGQTVKIFDADGFIHLHCGRSKAKLRPLVMGIEYPLTLSNPFSTASLVAVPGFAQRVQQVAWAVHPEPERAPLCGVHVDGEWLYGCNTIQMAMVPLVVPIAEPITVPLTTLSTLLKDAGDFKVQASLDRLRMMPDDDTQISTTIFSQKYPRVRNIIRTDFQNEIKLPKGELIDAVTAMLTLVRGDRYPVLTVNLAENEIHFVMDMGQSGEMENAIVAEGGDKFTFHVTPTVLTQSLAGASGDFVKMAYGPKADRPLKIYDGRGYECHFMPRVVTSKP